MSTQSEGPLLVLLPGLGAVATTFIAGVEAVRQGRARPIGSLTQLAHLPVGGRDVPLAEALGLASLDDLVFASWDVYPDNAWQAAQRAGVLNTTDLESCRDYLSGIHPMKAAFDPRYVPRLDGTHIKPEANRAALVEVLRQDIRDALKRTGATRAVMLWSGSTEVHQVPAACHLSRAAFAEGLDRNDPAISPSQLYAWAALCEQVPIANLTPNPAADVPALVELSRDRNLPLAGKDLKTGQTLLKTVIAPGIAARKLGVAGWFSTNILGNRDGLVLAEPEAFRAKEATKTSVLDTILDRTRHPELYGDFQHDVHIHYYAPRGDQKEGWDNVDLVGWMGYPMQLKINFLCRDSILAAPLLLDLALLLDRAAQAGLSGPQDWLSFYFKSPHVSAGQPVVHDLFAQERMLFEGLDKLITA